MSAQSSSEQRRTDSVIAIFWWLLTAAALLWPAFYNGYPLLMGDSFRYMGEALGNYSWVSSQFYGYYLRLFVNSTLWLPILGQALVASFVVITCLRRVFGLGVAHAGVAAILVAVFSPAALFASLVMTDIWFGVGLVALTIVLLGEPSRAELVAAMGIVAFCAAAHPAALPLFALVAAGSTVMSLVRRTRPTNAASFARAGRVIIAIAIALGALSASNSIVWSTVSPNPHSSVVAFAYLLTNGDLDEQLEGCEEWLVCELEERPGHGINNFNRFLFGWRSPLRTDLGGPVAYTGESRDIVTTYVLNHPVEYVSRVVDSGFHQLTMTSGWAHINFIMGRLADGHLEQISDFSDDDKSRAADSRLYQKDLNLSAWDGPYRVVGLAGLVAVIAACAGMVMASRTTQRLAHLPDRRALAAAGLLISFYFLHAFVVGTTTYPAQRYGGRVLWLLALALAGVVASVLDLAGTRRKTESPPRSVGTGQPHASPSLGSTILATRTPLEPFRHRPSDSPMSVTESQRNHLFNGFEKLWATTTAKH